MKMLPVSRRAVILYWDGTVDREHELLLISSRTVGYCISEDAKELGLYILYTFNCATTTTLQRSRMTNCER